VSLMIAFGVFIDMSQTMHIRNCAALDHNTSVLSGTVGRKTLRPTTPRIPFVSGGHR
jgi:hypothetical protein